MLILPFRMQLAILHTNEGAKRQQAKTKDGSLRFSYAASKAKEGERVLKPIKEEHEYGEV